MDLNLADGFIFLAVISGVGTFVGLIATCVAFDDHESYAGTFAFITGIVIILFLISGFMAFAAK